jgi:5-methylcytosine-specific restriction enzyme A
MIQLNLREPPSTRRRAGREGPGHDPHPGRTLPLILPLTMPTAPPHPCPRHPGILLHPRVPCPHCQQARDRQRPEHFRFYTSRAWRTLRAWVLEQEPICACGQPTTDVDHVLPRRTHPHLEFVRMNLQALCHACHARRTQQGKLENGK